MRSTADGGVPGGFDAVRRAFSGGPGGPKITYDGAERVAGGRRLIGFWVRRQGAQASSLFVALLGHDKTLLGYSLLDLDDSWRIRAMDLDACPKGDAAWATQRSRELLEALVEGLYGVHPLSSFFREETGLWETVAGVRVKGERGMRQYRCEVDATGRQVRIARLADLW